MRPNIQVLKSCLLVKMTHFFNRYIRNRLLDKIVNSQSKLSGLVELHNFHLNKSRIEIL